jgi:hypothetical protein
VNLILGIIGLFLDLVGLLRRVFILLGTLCILVIMAVIVVYGAYAAYLLQGH